MNGIIGIIKKTGFLVFAGLICLCTLHGQDQLVERVEVLNREVVVRVFDGGEPVYGLQRKDFSLLENGSPLRITSLREVRRALSPLMKSQQQDSRDEPALHQGRLFLFLMWWNEESRDWPETWRYFTTRIFRPGDRVILADDRQAIQIHSPDKEKEKLAAFFRELNQRLKLKKQEKILLAQNLEHCARNFYEALMENAEKKASFKLPEIVLLNEFFNRYSGILEDYRLARLRAQPEMMRRLAEALRGVDTEKWALLFMQNERLPLLHSKSRLFTTAPMQGKTVNALRIFTKRQERKMLMATDMAAHARDLRSLFIGAGATFHLFLSDAREETAYSDQLRWQPVFSSWEAAFRDIARDTGGDIKNTTRLQPALESAATHPDVYYVLTYKPKASSVFSSKLQIKVSGPNLDVVYARRLKPREILPMKISSPEVKEGTLGFELFNYLREVGESGAVEGDVHVHVSAKPLEGDALNFEKILHPKAEAALVEMKVHFPTPGDYILSVTATDRLSGNSTRGHTKIHIDSPRPTVRPELVAPPMDPRLQAVMDKAATYCRRLQRAAFRFTCTEWVKETSMERNPLSGRVEKQSRHWRYDYQVVGEGKITEQRRMLGGGHKQEKVENAQLETRFASRYSVFMPVTLLGKQNRGSYHYRLLEADRLKGRSCAVVEVTPRREGEGPLAQGKVWVDVEDGSILKIEMYPRGVQGSQALAGEAEKISAQLELKVIHWYMEQRRGLRFPSKTEFSESYRFDKRVGTQRLEIPYKSETHSGRSTIVNVPYIESHRRRVEFYHLSQEYKNYRYFEVSSSVDVETPK